MALYEKPSLVGYNSNPPSDDGARTAVNEIRWSGIKTKFADPLKTYIDAVNDAANAAMGVESFLQSGTGAVATDLQTRGRLQLYLSDFLPSGYVRDGSTDYATQIQACVDYAALTGADIICPPGVFGHGAQILIQSSHISFVGTGGDTTHSTGSANTNAGTVFKWVGSVGGTQFYWKTPLTASAQKKVGGGMRGIALDSGYDDSRTAAIGIRVTSLDKMVFSDVFGYEHSTAVIKTDCHDTGTLGEQENVQECIFSGVTGHTSNGGGSLFVLDGNSEYSRNTSMNLFMNCDATFDGLSAVGAYSLRNCDNNLFIRCRAYCASSGSSAVFYASGNSSGYARDNIFLHFSSGNSGAIVAQGTETATYQSRNNTMLFLDTGNATPDPTVGTSATMAWSTTNRRIVSHGIQSGAFGNNTVATQAAQNNIGTSESLRIHNSGANHIYLVGSPDVWSVDVNSTDLRIRRVSGSGVVQITNDIKSGHIYPNADSTYNLGKSTSVYVNAYVEKVWAGTGNALWTSGSGSPEGEVSAAVGSLYTDILGASGSTLYVKESGTGNTGWAAK